MLFLLWLKTSNLKISQNLWVILILKKKSCQQNLKYPEELTNMFKNKIINNSNNFSLPCMTVHLISIKPKRLFQMKLEIVLLQLQYLLMPAWQIMMLNLNQWWKETRTETTCGNAHCVERRQKREVILCGTLKLPCNQCEKISRSKMSLQYHMLRYTRSNIINRPGVAGAVLQTPS